jgi:hypothetical protein
VHNSLYERGERSPEMPGELLDRLTHAAPKELEFVLRFMRMTGCRLGGFALRGSVT